MQKDPVCDPNRKCFAEFDGCRVEASECARVYTGCTLNPSFLRVTDAFLSSTMVKTDECVISLDSQREKNGTKENPRLKIFLFLFTGQCGLFCKTPTLKLEWRAGLMINSDEKCLLISKNLDTASNLLQFSAVPLHCDDHEADAPPIWKKRQNH